MQPWANHFLREDELGTEPFYPLRVVHCVDCHTAQLDYTVPKETMFGDHTYLSGVTKSLSAHFRRVAEDVHARIGQHRTRPSVLDIGSNDGTQLRHYQDLGWDVFGVESSKSTSKLANEAGIPTVNEFFNLDLVRSLGRRFDVINASGVFFHLEELHSVVAGIREGLADGGLFAVQFLYMPSILANRAFDQIYHEHLLYYSLETIQVLLRRHGLELFDARLDPIHGGSIIGFATHVGCESESTRLRELLTREEASGANDLATCHRFANEIAVMKNENLSYLRSAAEAGKRVFGMGAPVKGNTLLNYFGIDRRLMECVVEKNRLRKGLFTPGTHLPVLIEDELPEPPDIYYVLAWNFKREILANNTHLLEQGVEFFFPVNPPEVSP
jgi:SAM-dependent methyltransferase